MALEPRQEDQAQDRRDEEALSATRAVAAPSRREELGLAPSRFSSSVASLACALVLVACGGGSQQIRPETIQADVATYNREHTADKLVSRGKGFAAVGDYLRAEEYLADAMAQGADPKKVMPLLLEVCIKEGRYRLAAQYAKDYLVAHPNDVPVRLVLASLYSATGDTKLAKNEFERVIEARPSDAQAHYAFAVLLRDAEQDPVAADFHFREYLRLAPKGSHAEEARSSMLHRVSEAP